MTPHQTRILQAIHTLGGYATDRDVDKVLFSGAATGPSVSRPALNALVRSGHLTLEGMFFKIVQGA